MAAIDYVADTSVLVDALVAAIAEARDITVLHYDSDFELVAEVTNQPQRWIVPRGSAD